MPLRRILTELVAGCGDIPLELPEEWGLEEDCPTPGRRIVLQAVDHSKSSARKTILTGTLLFDYPGKAARLTDGWRRELRLAEGRILRRNTEVEAEAHGELLGLGSKQPPANRRCFASWDLEIPAKELPATEYVFLLDPWWNPAVEAQAINRAHRIGQTRSVFAYRLIARNTVEEKVLELQGRKRAIAAEIMDDDNSVIRGLGREDLKFLLSGGGLPAEGKRGQEPF